MTSAILSALRSASDALDGRMRHVVSAHHDALWRFLRRMGVPEGHVDDAAQQVLLVFARRASDVEEGSERSFLFGTALRVASEVRRRDKREPCVASIDALNRQLDPAPSAEQQLGQAELRRCLDQILDELTPECRAVFVLAEIEETTMAEISRLLGIPAGTVASRLRRARELVEAKAAELRAQFEREPTR